MRYERAATSDHEETQLLQSEDAVAYFPVEMDEGSFYDGLYFNWVNPLVLKANDGDTSFNVDDMYHLPTVLTSKEVFNAFKECWSTSTPDKNGSIKLWKVLHQLIFVEFWVAGLCRLGSDMLLLLSIVLIQLFIRAAEVGYRVELVALSIVFLMCSVGQAVLLQQFIHGSFMAGSKVVSAATSASFHSALVLRLHKMYPTRTIGEINNIAAKDTSSLREFVVFAHNLWALPITIIGCVVMILHLLGFAGLICCVILPLLIPIESYLSDKSRAVKNTVLKFSDQRLHLINQLIDGMKTIRLTNLANYMQSRISSVREEELESVWDTYMIETVNIVIAKSVTMVLYLCVFGVYIWMSPEPLSAERAFTALAAISILQRPMQVLPKCVSLYNSTVVSCNRIEGLLYDALEFDSGLFDENFERNTPKSNSTTGVGERISPTRHEGLFSSDRVVPTLLPTHFGIILKNVSAVRPPDTNVLRSVNLSFTTPGLNIIIGRNGSGKSSLLLAMMNELNINNISNFGSAKGSMLSPGSSSSVAGSILTFPKDLIVGYCGHEPWILNTTARMNILIGDHRPVTILEQQRRRRRKRFGTDVVPSSMMSSETMQSLEASVDEERYQAAINACALCDDFMQWPNGENTELGERGLSISGGQKQRIALARAIYSQSNLVLLDGCLSALDAMVSSHVFQHAIVDILSRDRIVLMSTHQKQYQPYADRIVVLDAGKVFYDGSYSEMADGIGGSNGKLKPVGNSDTSNNAERVLETKSTAKTKSLVSVDTLEVVSAENMRGKGRYEVYRRYVVSCGLHLWMAGVFLTVATYVTVALADYQLVLWTEGYFGAEKYIEMYSALLIIVIALHGCRYFLYSMCAVRGSRSLHQGLLSSIMHAQFGFFDVTPSGRITTRFSVDFNTIDFQIPISVATLFESFIKILTGVGMVIFQSPFFIILLIPLTYKYIQISNLYRIPSKILKQLDSAAKAPLFSHFKETLEGLENIRGYRIQTAVINRHHELLDRSVCARLNWDAMNRWLGIRLDIVGALIISFAVLSVALYGSASAGMAGLMINYALLATQSLSLAVRTSTATENMFISPERVLEYSALEEESVHHGGSVDIQESSMSSDEYKPNPSEIRELEMVGISTGAVALEEGSLSAAGTCLHVSGISARYTADLPLVLKDLSFTLYKGELVGICGRTGCGKSTLSLALAGALKFMSGSIFIRGIEKSKYPSIQAYRKEIQVFPQDSYILEGTLRDVLDPERVHEDAKLNYVLHEFSTLVKMKDGEASAKRLSLNDIVEAGGNNLSAGQKQVLVLSRAALAECSVIVLDELFSNLDMQSARRAMTIIKEEVLQRGLSVLLIAHTLQDIALCNAVLVMEKGHIVERGKPLDLLTSSPDGSNPSNIFTEMVMEMGGKAEVERLINLLQYPDEDPPPVASFAGAFEMDL